MSRREIRKVVLVGMSPPLAKPENLDLAWSFPSYGLRRIEASVRADPALARLEVEAWELEATGAEELAARLAAARADLVGFSTYVWSFATCLETARRLRRADPGVTLVFGGPAAEPAMARLEPYADASRVVDALVLGEGEIAVRELLAADPASWRAISGLALGGSERFERTAPRPLNTRLDELPSPAQMGLMPARTVGYLETFRGCPMTCSFCEWGVMEAGTLFSQEYLERELAALAALAPVVSFQVDAALNLNKHAFRNLAAAERTVGFLREAALITLLYPSLVDDEHHRFLEGVKDLYLTVGLQSFDDGVLSAVDRRVRRDRFERVIGDLQSLPNVRGLAIELILGLPTDSAECFRASLELALSYGCGVRVYHCLVLPNGLMSRAPAEQRIRFDPHTLKLTAAAGWTESSLAAEQERLSGLVAAAPGGYAADYWWYFPPAPRPTSRSTSPAALPLAMP